MAALLERPLDRPRALVELKFTRDSCYRALFGAAAPQMLVSSGWHGRRAMSAGVLLQGSCGERRAMAWRGWRGMAWRCYKMLLAAKLSRHVHMMPRDAGTQPCRIMSCLPSTTPSALPHPVCAPHFTCRRTGSCGQRATSAARMGCLQRALPSWPGRSPSRQRRAVSEGAARRRRAGRAFCCRCRLVRGCLATWCGAA